MLNVGFGEPEAGNNFNLYETNSAKIYISKSLTPKGNSLRIRLNDFLGIFKSLDVIGLNIL